MKLPKPGKLYRYDWGDNDYVNNTPRLLLNIEIFGAQYRFYWLRHGKMFYSYHYLEEFWRTHVEVK